MEKALERELEKIAAQYLDIETLKTRSSDRLDFHQVSVWSLKAALETAYELGMQNGRK